MDLGTRLTPRDGEKLASKLALAEGEYILFVASCSNWKPTAIDRLVITNQRLLASPAAWPKVVWETPLDAATCTGDLEERSVTVTPVSGDPMTFKKVSPSDHPRIVAAFEAAPATASTAAAVPVSTHPDPESPVIDGASPTPVSVTEATPDIPGPPAEKRQGLFAKAAAAVRNAAEEAEAQYQNGLANAGPLVLKKTFGATTVEVYENGYVRVSAMMTKGTPFEKLRSIKYTQQVQDKSAGGRAIAGAATMGLNYLASKEKRTLFLTIATDRKTHTLSTEGDMLRLDDKAGLGIEAAAQGVLAAATASPQVNVHDAPAPAAPQGDSLADQIKKLGDLHRDGVLSEEEFAAAKARLISGA